MSNLKNQEQLIKRITLLMAALGLKKYEFAENIDLTPQHLSNILKGRYNVTQKTIAKICKAYDVNEQWLLFGSGEMFTARPVEMPDGTPPALNPVEIPKTDREKFVNNLNSFDDTQWALLLSLMKDLMRGIK